MYITTVNSIFNSQEQVNHTLAALLMVGWENTAVVLLDDNETRGLVSLYTDALRKVYVVESSRPLSRKEFDSPYDAIEEWVNLVGTVRAEVILHNWLVSKTSE